MCEPDDGPLASDRARDRAGLPPRYRALAALGAYAQENAGDPLAPAFDRVVASMAALTEALEQAENAGEIAQAEAYDQWARAEWLLDLIRSLTRLHAENCPTQFGRNCTCGIEEDRISIRKLLQEPPPC